MRKISVEFTTEIDDYMPIVVQAEGHSLEELLDDAQWNHDVPDPRHHYAIGELHPRHYDRIVARIGEEFRSRFNEDKGGAMISITGSLSLAVPVIYEHKASLSEYDQDSALLMMVIDGVNVDVKASRHQLRQLLQAIAHGLQKIEQLKTGDENGNGNLTSA